MIDCQNLFLPQLEEDIIYNQKLMKLHQHDNGVTAFYRNEETFEYSSITGDLVIVTIPFSTMRFVEVDPFDSISHEKWKAIRELHYMPATKIGIQFKSRFWEEQGQLGGRIITDLPIRYAYYPSHGIGEKGPAIMLGSYTWSYDALLWDGLSKGDRIYYTLQNLATILGGQVYDEFLSGISKKLDVGSICTWRVCSISGRSRIRVATSDCQTRGKNILCWRPYNVISRMDTRGN